MPVSKEYKRAIKDKMHTDKKEKLATGSISTKRSALADENAIWNHQKPGVIEEGKIFFFYRYLPVSPCIHKASSHVATHLCFMTHVGYVK